MSLLTFHDFATLWANQPSFILTQILLTVGGLCTLMHAARRGSLWLFYWAIILINGLVLEYICVRLPMADTLWHSRAPLMLFDDRLPYHFIFIYTNSYYSATVAATLMKIRRRYKPLAVGVLALLINTPVDIIGSKFLQWTWHDSDPCCQQRSFNIPWIAYIFHFILSAIFATFFSILFDKQTVDEYASAISTSRNRIIYWASIFLPLPAAMILCNLVTNVLQFTYQVHQQVVFLSIFCISVACVWRAEKAGTSIPFAANFKGTKYLVAYLILHYSVYWLVALFGDPASQISEGLHQPMGDCNITEQIYTLFGQVQYRNAYFCPQNHDNLYFDFHCVPQFSMNQTGVQHTYTVCGTPHQNKFEFVFVLTCISAIAAIVFGTIFSQMKKPTSSSPKTSNKLE